MTRISIEWHKQKRSDYSFLAKDAAGNNIDFDPGETITDENVQVKPTQAVLMALGSSNGSDVISILAKHDQVIDHLKMVIEAVRTTHAWHLVTIAYDIKGLVQNVKAREACITSLRKYCKVIEILQRAGARVGWQLTVNNVSFAHTMVQVPSTW
jgi:uncharacterized OsmC-like protein